ncbi:MAG: LuxR C-terminal-related transcriptional regulator [Planctomycetota bacterium]
MRLLLAFEHRLDREAVACLAGADARFEVMRPLVSPSALAGNAEALPQAGVGFGALAESQDAISPSEAAIALLIDEASLAGLDQLAITCAPMVVLGVGSQAPWRNTSQNLPGSSARRYVNRDASWNQVAAALMAVVQQAEAARDAGLDAKPNAANPDQPASGQASAWRPPAPPIECDREARYAQLTQREREVFEAIAAGNSVRDCAQALHIAESTVDNHKSRLMKKLGVRKSVELVRLAFRLGVVS